MASSGLNLNGTLGAAFLGNIAAAIFYGITSIQTFIYFRKNTGDDRLTKSLIFFLWILDSVHMAFVTHALFSYLITNFFNPVAIAYPTWSVLGSIYVTCISDLIVRGCFGRRVWMLSGGNIIIAIATGITSVYVFAGGFTFASRAFIIGTFAGFSDISWLLYTSFGVGVLADGIIAASLCTLLARSRTGFSRTDSLVSALMLYTINTGLFTSICTAACFIAYAARPGEFIFIGFYFALSKIYVNALLANLNAREVIREYGNRPTTIGTPGILNNIEMPSLSSQANSGKQNLSSVGSAPVTVTIDTKYETFR